MNYTLGWRRSKRGRRYHFFYGPDAPVCGVHMRDVYLADDTVTQGKMCKKCLNGKSSARS